MARLAPGFILRSATAADAPALRALIRSARLDPTQLRWQQFLVIAHGAEIVACGQLRRFPGVRELGSLVVRPEWRGQGFAAALVEHLLVVADAPVYLECRAALVPFYKKFGFESVAWQHLPWPLKLKFRPMALLSRLSLIEGATMVHRSAIQE